MKDNWEERISRATNCARCNKKLDIKDQRILSVYDDQAIGTVSDCLLKLRPKRELGRGTRFNACQSKSCAKVLFTNGTVE